MIAVRGLSKVFRPPGRLRDLLRARLHGDPVTALDRVTFAVGRGEIVCLMGENGAGKTTLLRILAGLLAPSSGSAEVLGVALGAAGTPAEFRRRVALIIGEERSFLWSVSGRENLRFFAALHGLPGRFADERVSLLLERVGLTAAADRRFAEYSRGMRQRLALARGLLGDPELLLLDEPTLGLDPRGARDLRRFLRDDVLRGAGRTAVIGSNDPHEVRALAERVVFLRAGRLHGEGTPADIERELGIEGEE
jgi:ABC-2 type transport system ATP-binding protein